MSQRDQRDPIVWCPAPPVGCGKEVMVFNKRFGFWECPRCGFEGWPGGSKITALTPEEKAALHAPAERPVDSTGKLVMSYGYVPIVSRKKKGRSRSGRRHRKKKTFKPRRWEDERFW